MLELREVSVSYRRGGAFGRGAVVRVLEGASLSVGAGECVALLGPSGSGKSTLARVALGLERPDAGAVLFEGGALRDAAGRVAARLAVQAVFQDPFGATSPRFTAFEVIAEPLRYAGRSVEAVPGLAASVGLDPGDLGRLCHRYSGGQVQRMCIARALAHAPRLLVLDEAVSNLDLGTQAMVLDLLDGLRRGRGMGMLFITHDLRLIRGFADRVYVMDGGRSIEVGDPFVAPASVAALARLQGALLPAFPR